MVDLNDCWDKWAGGKKRQNGKCEFVNIGEAGQLQNDQREVKEMREAKSEHEKKLTGNNNIFQGCE